MLVCLSAAAIARKAPSSKPFERFDGCVLEPDEWTDGDSFRVRLPDGRLETFRLYFVDTTEFLRRQEAGLVSGVPTIRRIIGKREIDVYTNGLMFEKDNVVGVTKR